MDVERLKALFLTRTDRIGVYPDMSIQPDGKLDTYIARHLEGKKRLGFYCLNEDSRVIWGVIDVDNHSNNSFVKGYVKEFMKTLMILSKDVQLPFNVEVSKRGDYHTWLFFKEPIAAAKVRSFLRSYILLVGDKAELPPDWVESIEIFPKQDKLKGNGSLGNFVWLPFFGGKDDIGGGIPDGKTVFYDDNWTLTQNPKLTPIDESFMTEIAELLNLDMSTKSTRKKTTRETFVNASKLLETGTKKGSRNESAFEVLRHLKYQGLSNEMATPILHNWNQSCDPPLTLQELNRVIDSVYSDRAILTTQRESFSENQEENPNFNLTDAGNAELLIHLHGHEMRFNHTQGQWYVWNGQFWEKDYRNKVMKLAIDAARFRQRSAADIEDLNKKNKLFQFGLMSENKNKIGFCLDIAKSFDPVATVENDWDQNLYLLQFTNGILDPRTMEFYDGKPEYMISQCTGYDYDPKANCPTWEKVIFEIMNGNLELVKFIQKAMGYSLIGDISEQCFFLLWGTGANGKTVVLIVFRLLLGDYAQDSPFTAFECRYGNTQSNDLARLHSARLVTSAESGGSKRLNEERIKAITGGDPITARFLYQEYFEYNSKFKLWLSVNSLPKVKDFSYGFWRRVRLIPFEVQFDGENSDSRYLSPEYWKRELPGIMNWALKGFRLWKNEDLKPPAEVIKATKDYQIETDVVAGFLSDFTVIHNDKDIDVRIKASDLYSAFVKWHESEYTDKPISQTTFGRRVSLVTGKKSNKVGGLKYYFGLEMKDDDEIPF